MKITRLTTYIVPPRWVFLKIETDEGITGWGEPVLEGRAHTVVAAVDELGDYLIGKDPFLIEDHWTVMYRAGFYRGGGIHMSAIAGIDQALWDIKGKALGQPVHQLLGGQRGGGAGGRGARLHRREDERHRGAPDRRQPREDRPAPGARAGHPRRAR